MLSDKSTQAIEAAISSIRLQNDNAPAADTRSTATMDAIKAYILQHGLRTGDRLPTEASLCADLGVSRSSVREALRKLEALDIVTVRQGSGSYVGTMSLQPLVETLVLRSALDEINGIQSLRSIIDTRRALDLGIAPGLLAAMKGKRDPRLWDLADAMRAKAQAGRTSLAEDIAFHSALLESLHNPLMSQLVSAMWLIYQALAPQLETASEEHLLASAEAHAAILRACESGDVDAYRKAIEDHYLPLLSLIGAAPAAHGPDPSPQRREHSRGTDEQAQEE